MSARSIRVLLFVIAFMAAALAGFGVGEWEDTGEAQEAEPPPGVAEPEEPGEPEAEEPEESEQQASIMASVDDTAEAVGLETEPLVDTFPVVHVDVAAQPQPRNPGRVLDSIDTSALADKLEADRLLLSEIRKDVPGGREEAEMYLARLKKLAQQSDPVRLAPLFNRVLDQAPIYFKWVETEYESQDERITEYYVGGARGFAFAMDNFKSAVFFVIMNRLDIASRVISALEEK